VGDYSENPFEGLPNDVPMLAICRSIEIDLREMIKDEHIPDPIKPRESILM
jgi:putative membrane protein